MIWFVPGFIAGGFVIGWVVWRDLYWQHKEYFDKIREHDEWKKTDFRIEP